MKALKYYQKLFKKVHWVVHINGAFFLITFDNILLLIMYLIKSF